MNETHHASSERTRTSLEALQIRDELGYGVAERPLLIRNEVVPVPVNVYSFDKPTGRFENRRSMGLRSETDPPAPADQAQVLVALLVECNS